MHRRGLLAAKIVALYVRSTKILSDKKLTKRRYREAPHQLSILIANP
jgi:hypothetical protein